MNPFFKRIDRLLSLPPAETARRAISHLDDSGKTRNEIRGAIKENHFRLTGRTGGLFEASAEGYFQPLPIGTRIYGFIKSGLFSRFLLMLAGLFTVVTALLFFSSLLHRSLTTEKSAVLAMVGIVFAGAWRLARREITKMEETIGRIFQDD